MITDTDSWQDVNGRVMRGILRWGDQAWRNQGWDLRTDGVGPWGSRKECLRRKGQPGQGNRLGEDLGQGRMTGSGLAE